MLLHEPCQHKLAAELTLYADIASLCAPARGLPGKSAPALCGAASSWRHLLTHSLPHRLHHLIAVQRRPAFVDAASPHAASA